MATKSLFVPAVLGLLAASLAASEGVEKNEKIRALEARLRSSPDQGDLLFRLARERALAGDTAGTLDALDKAIATGLDFDVDAEDAFRPLRDDPKFMALLDRALEQRLVVHRSKQAFRVPDKELVPEGLAHDPVTGAFFLSSVYKRKVVRVGADGEVRDFTPSGQDGFWQGLGMKVDPKRRRLWVVTAAGEEAGAQDGCSAVLVYDLASGTLARRYALDNAQAHHFLNDVALAADGGAFVTDSRNGSVWRIDPGKDGLAPLVKPFTFEYPNGVALSGDERRLYVADGTRGITIVDPASGALRALSHPENVSLYGIDGLYVSESTLVGVQNSAGTERIVRYRLDPEGARVLSLDVLESRNPDFAIPTTGVVVGTDFYYIANSHVDQVGPDGKLKSRARLEPPIVLRVALDR